ncbi:MAG: hypothetical protein EXS25_04265 [Pedosphaera sp.]|nr:hypothetical protein [Pedosphaera sp.]
MADTVYAQAQMSAEFNPVTAQRSDPNSDSVSSLSTIVEQLGIPENPRSWAPVTRGILAGKVLAELREGLIQNTEWPAILQAAELTRRGYHRELLQLDQRFGRDLSPSLAKASCCVGRHQLGRLRALRDQKIIQCYLDAIETGQARGWNPIVFGVVLAVFGIPLRQGLVHYATALLRNHAEQIAVNPAEAQRLLDESVRMLPESANKVLDSQPKSGLQIL